MSEMFYEMIVGMLAVWRLTHFLHAEDGPWDLMYRIRKVLTYPFFSGLLSCFYCLSLWVSTPIAWIIGESAKERILLILALSGGAILLQRITQGPIPPYIEDEHLPHS